MYKFVVKDDCDLNDITDFEPALWILFTNSILFCKRHNIEFRITSLVKDRKNVKAVSTTHEDHRAFDISHRTEGGWNDILRNKFKYELNRDFVEIGAISYSDQRSRPCIYKPDHFHIQVRRNACVDKFVK
tara:strand:- start:9 stop:398 length:390 start_codon:yes stop_codon:yes gene_type:complete